MGNIFTLVTGAVWYTLVVIGDWMLFRKAGNQVGTVSSPSSI